jgi:hypothetical protein
MKNKLKWHEKQFAILVICTVLFMTWYWVSVFISDKHFIYESELFSIILGLIITSGVLMITVEVFGKEYNKSK